MPYQVQNDDKLKQAANLVAAAVKIDSDTDDAYDPYAEDYMSDEDADVDKTEVNLSSMVEALVPTARSEGARAAKVSSTVQNPS